MIKPDPTMPPEQTAVLSKYVDGIVKRADARELMTRANELRAEGTSMMERARDAADLLGFDIEEALDRWALFMERADTAYGPPQTIDLNAAAPAVLERRLEDERPTVREFILAEALAAAPGPVRAADLRKKYEEKYALTVHEKTFGMTLYRLSERDFMRREGHADWYFIPEHARPPKQHNMDFDEGAKGRRNAR